MTEAPGTNDDGSRPVDAADPGVTRFGDLGRILVIIPTFNERENVELITERVRTAVPEAHVLIADDNSPDGTGHIADRMASADAQVHVLHRLGKEGLGAAYKAGFQWALEHDFDVIVEMDADGSHKPEELHLLLDRLRTADLVLGSRWVEGGSVVDWPKSRELLSRGGNLYTRLALKLPLHDATGGYRAFRAATLRQVDLNSVGSAGYIFQVDLAYRVLEAGLTVAEVPITFEEREHGTSKMDNRIVREALWRVTVWGVDNRAEQFRKWRERRRHRAGSGF
jgi:dolichol-phosphate mannosyltransferase